MKYYCAEIGRYCHLYEVQHAQNRYRIAGDCHWITISDTLYTFSVKPFRCLTSLEARLRGLS